MKQLKPAHRLLDELRLAANGVPIYVQLRDQVLRALAAGGLAPGDQMPTMRQVAVALRIDLNTVRRAYDELERAGALTLQHGRGTFFAAAPAPHDARAESERLDCLARQTLATAAALGLDPTALLRRLTDLIDEKGALP